MSTIYYRLLNVSLQGITMGARFFFIFFLAKYLDPASVGYYGLFTATIGYCLYFVGLDFYAYVTREILKSSIDQRGKLLKGQIALSSVLYILFFPIALWFLRNSEWPEHLVLWFFPILFFEHFNQEMSRLLVALSEQIAASLILFVRQGSWAVVLVVLMNMSESTRNLDAVMALWTTAGALSAGLAIWKLRCLNIGGWLLPVDWKWIKKGIAVSLAFLIATLALRGVQTLDRYWLQALGGIEAVGAYVLMLGVAGTLLSFLDAGIFAYAYPALINNHHNNEQVAAKAKVRQVLLQTLLVSVAFGTISWIMLPYLLAWIDKPLYLKAINFYPWLLMAMIFNALSMVPHIALYAQGYDKPIIYSHIASLLTFILATWLLSDKFKALSVPMGLNSAFVMIFIFKAMAYWKICKEQNIQKSTFKVV